MKFYIPLRALCELQKLLLLSNSEIGRGLYGVFS